MKPKFNENKTTQLAAVLLKMRDAPMSYLKLIKLMYLVDREALIRWGRPLTFDWLVSMPHGCALSETLNLITEERPPDVNKYWKTHISQPANYEVSLLSEPKYDELSDKEKELIKEIYGKYGRYTRWQLRELTHQLPEYHDPHGSSIAIDYKDILASSGKTPKEIEEIIEEIEGLAFMDNIFP